MLTPHQLASLKQKDPELYTLLKEIVDAVNRTGVRLGLDFKPAGQVAQNDALPAPNPPSKIEVTTIANQVFVVLGAGTGNHDSALYFVERSSSPQFTEITTYQLGNSLSLAITLAPGTYHWRAYARYPDSRKSQYATYGTAGTAPGGTGAPTTTVAAVTVGSAAGGVLSGTYPNPGFAVDMAEQSELNAVEGFLLAHHTRHENNGADEISVAGLSGVLADPQTPIAHAASHQSGGGDAIKLDDLAAPDDNTDLDVSITKHGLAPKAPNDATKFLNGVGAYSVPPGGGTPGGADTQVQFNDGGAFGGSAKLTHNKTTGATLVDGQLDLNSHKMVNVTNPTAAQDAATKDYVDTKTGGAGGFPRGCIDGLIVSNNATANKLDLAPGVARDSTNTADIILTTAITAKALQTSGAWAAGSTANGLDIGAAAASTWYHLYVIKKDSDGTGDFLFSLSATAPTMPAGYTYFRLVGSRKTDGSKNFPTISQMGDEQLWSVVSQEGSNSVGTSSSLITLAGVPTGRKVWAIVQVSMNNATAGTIGYATSPDQSDEAPGGYTATVRNPVAANTDTNAWMKIRTNTSGQIRLRASVASSTMVVACYGWIDPRGKDA